MIRPVFQKTLSFLIIAIYFESERKEAGGFSRKPIKIEQNKYMQPQSLQGLAQRTQGIRPVGGLSVAFFFVLFVLNCIIHIIFNSI